MKIIVIRHGQTLFNKMDLAQGWCDSPLTPLGEEQARKTGELIADFDITEAYSSPSERAYDTTVIALGDRKVEVKRDKRLKELHFGCFEGVANATKNHIIPRNGFEPRDFKPYGGEDYDQMLKREEDFLSELTANDHGQTVLIGGHGVSLTILVHHLAKDSLLTKYPDFKFIDNGSAVELEYKNGTYEVVKIYGNYIH
ncbi:MAG: histidine phosphatase family protein [Eubacteriales bacterium]|nr:histidine phosphatase family protein [Eubacteriales bacterium]